MIDKDLLTKEIERDLEGTSLFLVELSVSLTNEICVEIDSAEGVDIEACAKLTRQIEAAFDRDKEDYELEVGSSGLTSPFKVRAQYAKNIGNDVEILTKDGRKLYGVLTEVGEGSALDKDVDFTIEVEQKVKEPGAKRPVLKKEALNLTSADCKYVRYDIKF